MTTETLDKADVAADAVAATQQADWDAVKDIETTFCVGYSKYGDGTNETATLEQTLLKHFNGHIFQEQKDGRWFCPVVLKDGRPASVSKIPKPGRPDKPVEYYKKNLVNVNLAHVGRLFPIDLDEITEEQFQRIVTRIEERGLAHVRYSSYSHRGAAKFKARIVLFTNQEMPADTDAARDLISATRQMVGLDLCEGLEDEARWNAAGVMYLPACDGSEGALAVRFNEFKPGKLLDLTPYIEQAQHFLAEERAGMFRAHAEEASLGASVSQEGSAARRATRDELEANIRTGACFHTSMCSLIPMLRYAQMSRDGIADHLRGLMDECYEGSRRWNDRYDDIDRLVNSQCGWAEAQQTFKYRKAQHERALAEQQAAAEAQERAVAGRAALDVAVAAVGLGDLKKAGEAMKALARLQLDPVEEAEFLTELVERVAGAGAKVRARDAVRKPLADTLKAAKRVIDAAQKAEERSARQHGGGSGSKGGSGVSDALPTPPPLGGEAEASEVRAEWDHAEQVRVTRSLFERKNRADPRVYVNPEGRPIRLLSSIEGMRTDAMTQAAWAYELGRQVTYRKRSVQEGDKGRPIPPAVVMEVVGASDLWLPVLRSINHFPLFLADGSLQTEKGYVEPLEMYLDPNIEVPEPKADPTDDDVALALATINEPLRDIAFSDAFDGNDQQPYKIGEPDVNGYRTTNPDRGLSSLDNYLAFLIDPHVRHLAGAPGPAFHLDKAVPGEGAGLLMDIASILDTGEGASIRTVSNPDEFEKALTAAYSKGAPRVYWDNATGTIESDALAALLTAHRVSVRQFGKNNKEISFEVTSSSVFTGNNVRFHRDLTERMIPVRLNSGLEDPAQERDARATEFFKHADLKAYMKENRGAILSAVHTLIRAWFVNGKPKASVRHPRYRQWSDVVGGILENAYRRIGRPCHFLRNLSDYSKSGSQEGQAHRAVVQRIVDRYGVEPFSMSEALDACRVFGGGIDPALRLPVHGKSQHGETVSFSRYFDEKLQGRAFTLPVAAALVEKYGWTKHAEGGAHPLVRVRIVRAGKDDLERWHVVTVV